MEKSDLTELLAGIRQENAVAHAETRRHFEGITDETRRHFDVVSEATRKDVRLLAEAVSHVQEELVRTRDHLELKIEESAAETRAMIKVSHGVLDRRVAAIESKG